MTNHSRATKYLTETSTMVDDKEVINIHTRWNKIARVTGCLVILMSKPPSYISRNRNTSITPKRRGSVGTVSAANSLNSSVNESGIQNKMKNISLSKATSAEKIIRTKRGKTGK